ncbi:hypothetical protein BGZ51_002615 [Haplosporangium sp. Z 767]|nr:hypothetical protein BGZ51_002615 [Haplosporangium sp. Z 767]
MPSDVKVIIVGGGIGGLSLANMFEHAGIDYIVLEKAAVIKGLGSSLGLDASSLPVMEQMGLLEDFHRVSMPVRQFNFYNEAIESLGLVDFACMTEIGGYPAMILDRPAFYDVLLKNVPKTKIHYGKRVESIEQDEKSATVHCADGSSYTSDIIIGADGAYSAVRQDMYKKLAAKGKLSKNDAMPLCYDQHCLDPKDHEMLRRETCDFEIVLPKNDPFYAIYMPLPGHRVSWAVIHNVPKAEAKSGEGKLSEWGTDASVEMANFVRNQPSPFKGTLGDIIDKTPKELISKIMLEEKFFETWYDGRVVLLGDACHKVVPSAGLGANLAILDGVHLCNLLVDLPTPSQENITLVFQNYFEKRSKIAQAALNNARQFGKVMSERGFVSEVVRKIFLNYIPDWMTRWSNTQRLQYRPQLHFLKQVPDRGTPKALPQEPRISRAMWLLVLAVLAMSVISLVSAHKGGHGHVHVPKDKVHANVDPKKAGDCPFHGAAAAAKSTDEKEPLFNALPLYDEHGKLVGSNVEYDDIENEHESSSSRMKALFAFLFPGSPMVNSLLGTTYISLIPNLLLYFVPPDIKPESLNTLVAFAVGGLLGDVFLHLLPHSFLGEVHTGDTVTANETKNVVVGLGIFVGFFIFFCIDKVMRVVSGGDGGHGHSHGHAHDHGHGKKVDGEDEHDHSKHAHSDKDNKDSSLRQRKGGKEQAVVAAKDEDEKSKKEISNSIKLSAYLNLIADATHNFTDGLAMAASFYTSPAIGATTTVAVFFHEIPHEVGDYAILIQSGFPRSKAMMSQFITAIGAFLGTLAGIAIEEMSKAGDGTGNVAEEQALALFGFKSIPMRAGDLVIPFTAGGFLYIATVGVIPELLTVSGKFAKDAKQFASEIVAMLIGVGMMTVIALNE